LRVPVEIAIEHVQQRTDGTPTDRLFANAKPRESREVFRILMDPTSDCKPDCKKALRLSLRSRKRPMTGIWPVS
jgi:hypothetical protein